MTNEIFSFSPTAYDVERQKQAKQTAKQLLNEGRKQLKKAVSSYTLAMRNSTTGMQFSRLKHVESVAKEYGIELDVYFKWMLALHGAAHDRKSQGVDSQ